MEKILRFQVANNKFLECIDKRLSKMEETSPCREKAIDLTLIKNVLPIKDQENLSKLESLLESNEEALYQFVSFHILFTS